MPRPRTPPLLRLSAVAVAAVALSACASAGSRHDADRPADTAVVVRSTGWLNGVFEAPAAPAPNAPTKAPTGSPALEAHSPWLGTIGLRQLLPGNCELGFGVALPNPYAPSVATMPQTERFRDVGVGLWLKFDF